MQALRRCEDAILVVLFLTTFIVLSLQIISRYGFSFPLFWSEELSRLLFTWIVFLGAAYVMRENGHVAITLAVDKLTPKVRRGVAIIMQTGILIFLSVIVWTGFVLTLKVANLPMTAMGISSAWEYAAVPTAASLMLFRTFSNVFVLVRGTDLERKEKTIL